MSSTRGSSNRESLKTGALPRRGQGTSKGCEARESDNAEPVIAADDDPVAGYEPPAMAPTTKKGSTPLTTASGSGESGGSCERSSSQAK